MCNWTNFTFPCKEPTTRTTPGDGGSGGDGRHPWMDEHTDTAVVPHSGYAWANRSKRPTIDIPWCIIITLSSILILLGNSFCTCTGVWELAAGEDVACGLLAVDVSAAFGSSSSDDSMATTSAKVPKVSSLASFSSPTKICTEGKVLQTTVPGSEFFFVGFFFGPFALALFARTRGSNGLLVGFLALLLPSSNSACKKERQMSFETFSILKKRQESLDLDRKTLREQRKYSVRKEQWHDIWTFRVTSDHHQQAIACQEKTRKRCLLSMWGKTHWQPNATLISSSRNIVSVPRYSAFLISQSNFASENCSCLHCGRPSRVKHLLVNARLNCKLGTGCFSLWTMFSLF